MGGACMHDSFKKIKNKINKELFSHVCDCDFAYMYDDAQN